MTGFEVPLPVIALGTVIGLTYGVLAVGLVLVYRSNRIINFAHGQIGAFGAAIFGLLAVRWGVPYYLALPVGLAAGAGAAALSEIAVVRRLRHAPRIMSIVATLGVGEFLLAFSLAINSQAGAGSLFPQPPGMPVFNIGALRVTQAYSSMLVFTPLVVLALAFFLRSSRFGLAIRGAAANADVARMAGIFAGRMSTLAWAIAGGLAALTAILFAPSQGFVAGDAFGPALLLRALVAAVIGRMTSMPIALAGGVLVGIVEQALLWNYPRGGLVEMMLFVIILVALLAQRQLSSSREDEKGSWAAVQGWRPLPDVVRSLWTIRHLGTLVAVLTLAGAALLPLVITHSSAIVLVGMFAFAIVALSVGIVTGLGGQLSLGQFALGAVGAVASYYTTSRTGNFALGFLYAGLAAGGASLLIGLPALRLRGLLLTVTTLSFALATPAWLLQQPWMLGEGVDPGRPILFGEPLISGKSYYYVGLAVLVVVVWLARNVRASGIGRRLVAVRDNEDNARAFTVPVSWVKVQAFMLAGFVAGVGGAVYGHSLSTISSSSFPSSASIVVAVMAVVGGLGILSGPLLGALLVIAVPAFLPLDAAGLAATRFGLLIIILYAPGGLAQVFEPLRDRVVRLLARRAGIDLDAAVEGDAEQQDDTIELVPASVDTRPAHADPTPTNGARRRRKVQGSVLLEVHDVRRHFGGVHAVDGVTLEVRAGETLGLIGPNGAGKTTLFELIGGFTRPDAGQIVFAGQDVTRMGPEARAQMGLIRSFQDAALFPTMTVMDAIRLSMEKVAPTPFLPALLGVDRTERQRTERARELVARFGLEQYRDKQIQELSTGTRRIAELACLVALEPTLLLLDEPSSGIAQRETEALGGLLRDLKRDLDTTLVVIEHDIPLIMGLADRIVAMDTGQIIAVGTPEEVRHDERVVSSYLGGNSQAIGRSGPVDAAQPTVVG